MHTCLLEISITNTLPGSCREPAPEADSESPSALSANYLHSQTVPKTTERISSNPDTRDDASATKSSQRNWLSRREITESELASSSEYSVTFSNTHFTIPDCKESTRISKRQTLSWLMEEKGISDSQKQRAGLPSSPSGTIIGFISFLSSSAECANFSTSTSPLKQETNHA